MYSGRGIKGQKARAGHKLQPVIRRLIKRYPKKRGYRFSSQKEKPEIIKLKDLENNFENGAEVTPEQVIEKGIVRKKKGRVPKMKILGKKKLKKKLIIKEIPASKGASESIEKAGGETH